MTRPRGLRQGPSFGSHLLGSPEESERRRRFRVQTLLTGSIVLANLVGAVGVAALVALLVPGERATASSALVAGAIYLALAIVVGLVWGTRTGLGSLRWMFEERDPDTLEQRRTLRVPLRLVRVQAVLWVAAAGFFAVLFRDESRDAGLKIGLTVLLGGAVTCFAAYLLSEFAMRPVAAQALAAHPPDRLLVPGIRARSILAWATGSAIPVVGLIIGAVFALSDDSITRDRLAVTTLTLGGTTLVVGSLLTVLAVRATVDPIRSVRTALAQVEAGDLTVTVPVYDGTEVGLLQAGFNRMVSGLREREHIRDLFGRHVGEDVALDALGREIELGGELRQVAVLFVDVVGSTTLAAERPPTEVVALLNRFFTVVVDEVAAHGGSVNKLIGDAVLAVWNAPGDVDDPAGRALAAARGLARRLLLEVPGLSAGVGVAAGEVVAGNVGDERRFEYTVIGDPVNQAARLTELAKSVPGRVVASMATVDAASPAEGACWVPAGEITLRGRVTSTAVAHVRQP